MRGILEGDENFRTFSNLCEEKSDIEKELENCKISNKRRNILKKSLNCLEAEISESELKLQEKIKVS
jgi:hypothetical protein